MNASQSRRLQTRRDHFLPIEQELKDLVKRIAEKKKELDELKKLYDQKVKERDQMKKDEQE